MKTNSLRSDDLKLEISVRLEIRDGQAKLGFKKAWVIALTIAALRLAIKLWLDGS